jgi:hypothetical protein
MQPTSANSLQKMITIHPQRWANSALPWVKELVLQKVKNIVKRIIIVINR